MSTTRLFFVPALLLLLLTASFTLAFAPDLYRYGATVSVKSATTDTCIPAVSNPYTVYNISASATDLAKAAMLYTLSYNSTYYLVAPSYASAYLSCPSYAGAGMNYMAIDMGINMTSATATALARVFYAYSDGVLSNWGGASVETGTYVVTPSGLRQLSTDRGYSVNFTSLGAVYVYVYVYYNSAGRYRLHAPTFRYDLTPWSYGVAKTVQDTVAKTQNVLIKITNVIEVWRGSTKLASFTTPATVYVYYVHYYQPPKVALTFFGSAYTHALTVNFTKLEMKLDDNPQTLQMDSAYSIDLSNAKIELQSFNPLFEILGFLIMVFCGFLSFSCVILEGSLCCGCLSFVVFLHCVSVPSGFW
jgi:hypothetical protein